MGFVLLGQGAFESAREVGQSCERRDRRDRARKLRKSGRSVAALEAVIAIPLSAVDHIATSVVE